MAEPVMVKDKRTGEPLEVFDVAGDDYVFAGPVGVPENARMIHRDELTPDPFLRVLQKGIVPWAER